MIRVGIIGTSFITEYLIEAFKKVSGIEPYAIYSRTLTKAQAFNLPKAYDQLEAMLADEDIDLVYVASPNSIHYEQSKQALLAGKHVLCEKPLVGRLHQGQELFDLAERHNLYFMEAATTPHLPNVTAIANLLPKIGPIRGVFCNYTQYSSRYDALVAGQTPNIFNPEFFGGALGDLNIYNLHLIVALFGAPDQADYVATRHDNGVDLSGTMIMQYPEFVAISTANKNSHGESWIQIQGEKGYIYTKEKPSILQSFYSSLTDETLTYQPLTNYEYEISDLVEMITKDDRAMYEKYKTQTLTVLKLFSDFHGY